MSTVSDEFDAFLESPVVPEDKNLGVVGKRLEQEQLEDEKSPGWITTSAATIRLDNLVGATIHRAQHFDRDELITPEKIAEAREFDNMKPGELARLQKEFSLTPKESAQYLEEVFTQSDSDQFEGWRKSIRHEQQVQQQAGLGKLIGTQLLSGVTSPEGLILGAAPGKAITAAMGFQKARLATIMAIDGAAVGAGAVTEEFLIDMVNGTRTNADFAIAGGAGFVLGGGLSGLINRSISKEVVPQSMSTDNIINEIAEEYEAQVSAQSGGAAAVKADSLNPEETLRDGTQVRFQELMDMDIEDYTKALPKELVRAHRATAAEMTRRVHEEDLPLEEAEAAVADSFRNMLNLMSESKAVANSATKLKLRAKAARVVSFGSPERLSAYAVSGDVRRSVNLFVENDVTTVGDDLGVPRATSIEAERQAAMDNYNVAMHEFYRDAFKEYEAGGGDLSRAQFNEAVMIVRSDPRASHGFGADVHRFGIEAAARHRKHGGKRVEDSGAVEIDFTNYSNFGQIAKDFRGQDMPDWETAVNNIFDDVALQQGEGDHLIGGLTKERIFSDFRLGKGVNSAKWKDLPAEVKEALADRGYLGRTDGVDGGYVHHMVNKSVLTTAQGQSRVRRIISEELRARFNDEDYVRRNFLDEITERERLIVHEEFGKIRKIIRDAEMELQKLDPEQDIDLGDIVSLNKLIKEKIAERKALKAEKGFSSTEIRAKLSRQIDEFEHLFDDFKEEFVRTGLKNVDTAASDIVAKWSGASFDGSGRLQVPVGVAGALKTRTLNIPFKRLAQEGVYITDPDEMAVHWSQSVMGQTVMHEKGMGANATEFLETVRLRETKKIDELLNSGDKKKIREGKTRKRQLDQATTLLKRQVRRLRGEATGLEIGHGSAAAMKTLFTFNVLTSLMTPIFMSIADAGSVVARQGVGALTSHVSRQFGRLGKKIAGERSKTELLRVTGIAEHLTGAKAQAMNMVQFDQSAGAHKISFNRETSIASKFNEANNFLSRKAFQFNMLNTWTSQMRQAGGVNFYFDVFDAATTGKIPDRLRTQMGQSGLTEAHLKVIKEQIEKHGTKGDTGVIDPNLDLWDADGERVKQILNTAAHHEATLASPAIGLATRVAVIEDNPIGAIMAQFQSIIFALGARVAAPAIENPADSRRLAGFLVGVTTAYVVGYYIREVAFGREPKTDPATILTEGLARYGAFGTMEWVNNLAHTGTGGKVSVHAGASKLTGVDIQPSNRAFLGSNFTTRFGGVTAGKMVDAVTLANAFMVDKPLSKGAAGAAKRLTPLGQWGKIGEAQYENFIE